MSKKAWWIVWGVILLFLIFVVGYQTPSGQNGDGANCGTADNGC